MKLLFVCNIGENRSKTAAEIFSKTYETKYCGAYDGDNKLTTEMLDWADIVFVMMEHHRDYIGEEFPKEYNCNQIINLEIPDIYRYKQPALIKALEKKVTKWLKDITGII